MQAQPHSKGEFHFMHCREIQKQSQQRQTHYSVKPVQPKKVFPTQNEGTNMGIKRPQNFLVSAEMDISTL